MRLFLGRFRARPLRVERKTSLAPGFFRGGIHDCSSAC